MSYPIVCIGRQLGSGGHDIAERVAQRLGCKFYDKELLYLASKESGFCEKFFEQHDEHKGFLRSLFLQHGPSVSENGFYASHFSPDKLFQIQSDAIRRAAEQGPCLFVGRCADYVLRDLPHMRSVFITAPVAERIERIMQRTGKDRAAAEKLLRNKESERAAYYNFYSGKQWGAAESYDLCVNSALLGDDGTVDFICQFVGNRE